VLAFRIGHQQSASATATTQQAREKSGTVSGCALGLSHARVPSRVRSDLFLVAHKLFPRNITLMVIWNHNLPLFLRTCVTAGLTSASFDDGSAGLLPAPYEDAGIRGVLEDTEDGWVNRLGPDHLAVARCAR
jgi:hypothetical protein